MIGKPWNEVAAHNRGVPDRVARSSRAMTLMVRRLCLAGPFFKRSLTP
jgi:hypothetical protein